MTHTDESTFECSDEYATVYDNWVDTVDDPTPAKFADTQKFRDTYERWATDLEDDNRIAAADQRTDR